MTMRAKNIKENVLYHWVSFTQTFFLVLKVETKKNSIICHVIDEEGKLDMFWFGPNELLDLIKIS